jgi:hypothetical protein
MAEASEASQPFILLPFPGESHPEGLSLTGDVSRLGEHLAIAFRLAGPLQALQLPPLAPSPERRDNLWQSTCLECFLALPESPGYWELNLSPSGHWNVYRLEGYRQALAADPSFGRPGLERRPQPDRLELRLGCRLPPLLAAAPVLEMAITAVIATTGGVLSYWALHHGGAEADFHRRDGFRLRV